MICDLAEYYHILNYRELSPQLVATLVLGLSDNSRVKRHLSNQKLTIDQMLQALMVDALNFLVWTKTKDAQHKRNKPKSIFKLLTEENENEKIQAFESPEDFDAYMQHIRGNVT